MPIYQLDPIQDPRWPKLLERDSRASVFHTRGWLEALRRSYGYDPVVLTSCDSNKDLTSGILFCEVNSWITGRRLVSLPFSDHCEPLLVQPEELAETVSVLQSDIEKGRLKYVEMRTLNAPSILPPDLCGFGEFWFHKIDLGRSIDEVFQGFHKTSIRQQIRRAEREGLVYERGRDRALLEKFYKLFVMTRRRHGLPPSPLHWFSNLLTCLGENALIRIASKDGQPVAGIFTLTHNKSIVYKYGGSDMRFGNLGGTPFLFWRTIIEAKREDLSELDLGRSDLENEGLITFKERLGATRFPLTYRRLSRRTARVSRDNWPSRLARRVFTYASDPVRIQVGNLLYRHLG
jgi:hypothetical protein